MRIALITDAWYPQVNGVVRTLSHVKAELEAQGHAIMVIYPELFSTLACPTYPEIRLALAQPSTVARKIEDAAPDCIHIATEGTLGWFTEANSALDTSALRRIEWVFDRTDEAVVILDTIGFR